MSCPTCDTLRHIGPPSQDRTCNVCRRPYRSTSLRTRRREQARARLDDIAFSITLRQLIAMTGRRKWTEERIEAFGEAMLNSSFPDTVATVAEAVIEAER